MSHYLAFDYGLARIGVAVGQPLLGTATPLAIIAARDGIPDWSRIQALLDEWQPQKVIVGEPLNMDGSDQEITRRARKFANRLHGRFGIQVELFDERLSSAAAREELFEQGGFKKLSNSPIDSLAAAHILTAWFASESNQPPS